MKCPWLIKTTTETDNKNSYNNSRRVEHTEFDECIRTNCPFYQHPKCLRAEIELAKIKK